MNGKSQKDGWKARCLYKDVHIPVKVLDTGILGGLLVLAGVIFFLAIR